MAIFISDEVDFMKKITRDRERRKIKGPAPQEERVSPPRRTILNVCAPNSRAGEYARQKLIKLNGEIDESTIIVGASALLSQQWIEVDKNRQEDRRTQ